MIVEAKALETAVVALIQKVLALFAGPQFRAEVDLARKDFFRSYSIPQEGTARFEMRMSQFYDWYFFSRPLTGYGHSPLLSCYQTRELRFSTEEMDLIESLKNHRHSLFQVVKLRPDQVVVKDLMANEKLTIPDPNYDFVEGTEEIFEARLIQHHGHYVFTRGFCFHPIEASDYIFSEVKRIRKDPDQKPIDLMMKLMKMNLKTDQYKHVPVEVVYAEAP